MKRLLVLLLLGTLLLLTACGGGDVTTTTLDTTTTASTATTTQPLPTSPLPLEPYTFRYLSGDYGVDLYWTNQDGYAQLKDIFDAIQQLTFSGTHATEDKKGTPVGTLTWKNLSFENATHLFRNISQSGEITDEYQLENKWQAVKWISEDGFAVIATSYWEQPLWRFTGERVTRDALKVAAAEYMSMATGTTVDPSLLRFCNENGEALCNGIFATKHPYLPNSSKVVAFQEETAIPSQEGMHVVFDENGNITGFFCRSRSKAADAELEADTEQIDAIVSKITAALDAHYKAKRYSVISPMNFIAYQDEIAVLVKIRVTVYECIAHNVRRSYTVYAVIH